MRGQWQEDEKKIGVRLLVWSARGEPAFDSDQPERALFRRVMFSVSRVHISTGRIIESNRIEFNFRRGATQSRRVVVQNQNQFYFRADVKMLKQLWATIGDREVAKPSCPALNLFRACTLNGIPVLWVKSD